jgi:hypothetical protein
MKSLLAGHSLAHSKSTITMALHKLLQHMRMRFATLLVLGIAMIPCIIHFGLRMKNVESILTSSNRIAVFYNVFTKTNKDVGFVQSIVQEQMAHLLPKHEVFVRSIGIQFNISNTTLLLCHDEVGDEVGTLTLLWEYCKEHPNSKAVYIHTKGSFSTHERNNILRKFITRGALSQECANAPSHCNVCSSRMTPVPHPCTPGNMWLAKCNYIVKLIHPMNFTEAMANLFCGSSHPEPCVGMGSYAAEHWVHSHPTVMPCDLSTDLSYVWNYDHVPIDDFEMILMSAPRFDLKAYLIGNLCENFGISLNDRLREYDDLYAENVTESWWGWKLFILVMKFCPFGNPH